MDAARAKRSQSSGAAPEQSNATKRVEASFAEGSRYAAPLHEGDRRPRSEPQGDDGASIMNFDAHEPYGKDLVEAVSDSNFATDRNTRKSLSSGHVCINK